MGYNKADDIEFHIHAEYDSCDPACIVGLKAVDASSTSVVLGETTAACKNQTNTVEENLDAQAEHVFTVTLDANQADLATTIVNRTGQELPSTGGMGTTVIYIVGGILVLAAVVLLITKKRMGAAE